MVVVQLCANEKGLPTVNAAKQILPATIPPKTAIFGMVICTLLLLVFAIPPKSAQSAEPFWIDSLEKAQLAGLRLDLVQSGGICHGEQVRSYW